MKSLLLLLLMSNISYAGEAFVGYGIGIFGDANRFAGQNKYADVGYREFLWDGIYWSNKVGYWGEGSGDTSRKSSFWGASGLGLEVDLKPVEIRGDIGLALITNPDSQLGSRFPQFNENFSIGLRDKKGSGVAVQGGHLSCASFCSPNQGRSFSLIEFSQKW